MKTVVDSLLAQCPGGEPEYFKVSDWFDDDKRDRVESVITEYSSYYHKWLEELKGLLGEPNQTEKTHRTEIDRWWPEAIFAACWKVDSKTLCLALEQHDRETPVGVVLRCLSQEEISDLSQ